MADEDTTDEVERPETKAVPAVERSVEWEEAASVTGRPNDTPIDDPQDAPNGGNSTFAERAKARQKQTTKAQNKAVSDEDADTKKPAPKRTTRKKAS